MRREVGKAGSRRALSIAVFLVFGISSTLFANPALVASPAHAQSPLPTSFMRNLYPGEPAPNDGAAALVVEGLGAGLGGCSYDLNLIAFITITAINAGIPTITEISVQSRCSPNIQDWKNVVLQLVTNVRNSAPDADELWGGIMLDEEPEFWDGDSVAAYTELNNSVAILLTSFPLGIAWYYTETFSGTNDWSQAEFDAITGYSVAAPQIATQYMVQLTNTRQAATNENILVTWSLHPDYQAYPGLYAASGAINGAPYHNLQWGVDLSNCFRISQVCNDWDGDTVLNSTDNCIAVSNPSQTNLDGNFIGLSPYKTFDDLSRARSDTSGDECDSDRDGDGRSNSDEGSGSGCSGNTSDPDNADTDGDNFLDGPECSLSSDPGDIASKPAEASCGGLGDTDGDGVTNRREFCYYRTASNNLDTDSDGCRDGREVGSINESNGVDVIDLQQIAMEAQGVYALPGNVVEVDFDLTKNGSIDVVDLQRAAAVSGNCP